MASMTIRELADGLGVSKQTVTRALRALGMWEAHVSSMGDARGTMTVDAEAASAVAASIGARKKPDGDGSRHADGHDGRDDGALRALLDVKDERIEALRETVARQSSEIDRLSARVRELESEVGRASDRIAQAGERHDDAMARKDAAISAMSEQIAELSREISDARKPRGLLGRWRASRALKGGK